MKVEFWCNTHRRPAPPEGWGFYCNYVDNKWVEDTTRELRRCRGGGIMIPCRVINCKEVGIEIEWEPDDASRTYKDASTKG